jgi:peptidoglycan/LPS O-acetylase OafA/YrhL
MAHARLDHVQGLRGIAAAVVVLQHAFEVMQEAGFRAFAPLLASINLGRFGVVLFFLISGLVIPFSIRGSTPLRDFAVGRVFRLYPAYWLSIPALALVAAVNGSPPDARTIAANATMLQGFFGIYDIGPGYWTLKFEIMFYLLCAALWAVKLLDHIITNALLILAALALAFAPMLFPSLLGARGPVIEAPFFVAMFLVGMLLRQSVINHSDDARRWAYVLVPLSALVGLIVGGAFFDVRANNNVYFSPLALASSMALPVLIFVLILWRKPVPSTALLYLGTISYSLYLFQAVGLQLLKYVISPAAWPITYLIAVIVVSLALAAVVQRWVEEPMIVAGRKLSERLKRVRAQAPV